MTIVKCVLCGFLIRLLGVSRGKIGIVSLWVVNGFIDLKLARSLRVEPTQKGYILIYFMYCFNENCM